ncbi:MAG: hypothetical protein ACREMB_17590 [Candidatus Rokuibacteriota bacterium]
MRDDRFVVPADCVASIDPEATRQALRHLARVCDADVSPSDRLDLARLRAETPAPVQAPTDGPARSQSAR